MRWASAGTTVASSLGEWNELHRRTSGRGVRGGPFVAERRAVRATRCRDAGEVGVAADDGRSPRRPVPRGTRALDAGETDSRARDLHGLLLDLDGVGAAFR